MLSDKESTCGFDSWVGKIAWRKAWQPTPVFLPGEFHRQWSLAGYSPWSLKELDTTETTEHARTTQAEDILSLKFRLI